MRALRAIPDLESETRGTWLMDRMAGFDSVGRLPGRTEAVLSAETRIKSY
jgi:hypothetical protein